MSSDGSPALSTTLLLGAAAIAMALIAILGEEGSFTAPIVVAALVGLVPWALVVGGIDVAPWLFAVMGLVPAAFIVVVEGNPGGMFPLMLIVVWVTRVSASRLLVAGTILVSAACIVTLTVDEGSAHETGMVYFLGGIGISWLAGEMLRRQESLTAEVQAMQDLRFEQLAASERTRIAREVHDVVAHSLTIVMLNLTGARRALATQPERAEEALARAEEVGRESLDSIRQVMGLLREPGTGLDLPQPGLADLGPLVEGYRTAGLAVSSTVEAAVRPVEIDPTVQLVVFRVVQESLSNVLQHAPGAATAVEVVAADGRLTVTIANERSAVAAPAPQGRAGLGVNGMVERVRAVGGELHAGAAAGGGWRVTADIPVRVVRRAPTHDEVAWVTEPTAR